MIGNRELKFRVYDENWGMREVDWICFNNQIVTYTLDIDRCSGKGTKPLSECMQYTGYQDKNGKDIFVGDIVQGKRYPFVDEGISNYVGIVFECEGCVQIELKCVNSNKAGISDGISYLFCEEVVEELEVISNMYEIPEEWEILNW